MAVVSQSDPTRAGVDASGAPGGLGGGTWHMHKARADVSGRTRTSRTGSYRQTMTMRSSGRT